MAILFVLLAFPSVKQASSKIVIMAAKKPAEFLSEFGRGTKSSLSFFYQISDLRKQNAELSQKISEFEVRDSDIVELKHENELLKKELGFAADNKDKSLIPSKIISRDPSSFFDFVLIDKGEKDGIKNNMAVVSGGVLIGQVSDVYSAESKVTLVTSKDSIILAMLQNSRSKGVLKGGISGLVLENITQDVVSDRGENIVTSGLDGELKPGILIGKAGKVQSASSDVFKNISVEPIADLSKLELVFVLK